MTVLEQAMAVVRQAEESAHQGQRAMNLMDQAARLRELARMLEAEAMECVDYEMLGTTKKCGRK